MEEASSGREVNLEGMATFWRNLNLLPVWLKGRSDVIVCLQIHSQHTACSLKCLLAQASAGHENPKEAKESGMKFVGCEICTWDQRLPPAKSRLS